MKKNNNKLTFRKILTLYSLGIILVMLAINFTSLSSLKNNYFSFNMHLTDLSQVHNLYVEIDELYSHIDNYTLSGDHDYLEKYNHKLKNVIKKIEDHMERTTDNEIYYKYYDAKNMIATFSSRSDAIIRNHDVQMEQIYIDELLSELERLKSYIQEELQSIITLKLNVVSSIYSNLKGVILDKEGQTFLYTLIITIVCFTIAYLFSQQLSKPIHQLVIQLKKVAKGNYDTTEVKIRGRGELQTLIDCFNYMMVKLRKQMELINEKAVMQKKLQQEEIKNLEMANSLKQSQLNYLQSQINPHFLFNTLNSIGTLADIEDAKQTKMMLESLSELLRYNLKKINDIVTLEDEFNIIKNYIYIQMIRFGNKIQYNIHMDESVKDFMVPSMILQPFVENAMIHGLEQKEGKGHLTVEIKDESDHINILIKDDGIGMTQEQAESLLKYEDEIILNKNYTKGMGVCNVVKRLVLYFGENIVSIESGIAKGTSTTIKIPKESL